MFLLQSSIQLSINMNNVLYLYPCYTIQYVWMMMIKENLFYLNTPITCTVEVLVELKQR
jgi:hypothetical protein